MANIERPWEEENSFSKIHLKYMDRFVRFAFSYIHDYSAAEDIAIESILFYWENRHDMPEETNVPAYIVSIIKNKCINHLRRLQVHRKWADLQQEYYEWELSNRISTLEACEPYELFTKEIQEILYRTLESMSEKTRAAFIMSRIDKKTYKEIGALLNISPKGVDFHIQKALRILRHEMKDYFPLLILFF